MGIEAQISERHKLFCDGTISYSNAPSDDVNVARLYSLQKKKAGFDVEFYALRRTFNTAIFVE